MDLRSITLLLGLALIIGLSDGATIPGLEILPDPEAQFVPKPRPDRPRVDGKKSRMEWITAGMKDIAYGINHGMNKREAKNIILVVGNGMGLTTITATRILKGQQKGGTGENYKLAFETFDNIATLKTYSTDRQVSESAASATALMCGVKTNYMVVAVDESVKLANCSSYKPEADLKCISHWAQQEGYATGFVTDTRVTYATPAVLYSHSPSRWWEEPEKVPEAYRNKCIDIGKQLVDGKVGKHMQVIMGGGRSYLTSTSDPDPVFPEIKGLRNDGNLVNQWLDYHKKNNQPNSHYIWNRDQLKALDTSKDNTFVLGLFAPSHMKQPGTNSSKVEEPTLAEMTAAAIKILSKNKNGYFLLVNGGLIDYWHHDGKAGRALNSGVELDDAVEVIRNMVDLDETLVIVTADHAHGLTMSGYAPRGFPILGSYDTSDVDNMTYTTLLYATGPGYRGDANEGQDRQNVSEVNTLDLDYRLQSAVPRNRTAHSAQDTMVYATGPHSYLFQAGHEQTYVANVMAYATKIGKYNSLKEVASDASSVAVTVPLVLFLLAAYVLASKE